MKTNVKRGLDNLHLSDVFSLMLFLLYKTQDIEEYATLSELCYILDGDNLTRLLTYFAGQTIRIPTPEEFVILTDALLVYQYVSIDGMTLVDAREKIPSVTPKQWEAIVNLYLKIVPIMNKYNIDKGQIQKNA